MTTYAKGTFEATTFDEQTIDEFDDGSKVTRAHIVQAFSGDLEGELNADLVMHYRPDGTARFLGYQRFVGRVGDRTGSFMQEATGGYDKAEATTAWTVVPDSGTGELTTLSGSGMSTVPHGRHGSYTLDYEL